QVATSAARLHWISAASEVKMLALLITKQVMVVQSMLMAPLLSFIRIKVRSVCSVAIVATKYRLVLDQRIMQFFSRVHQVIETRSTLRATEYSICAIPSVPYQVITFFWLPNPTVVSGN